MKYILLYLSALISIQVNAHTLPQSGLTPDEQSPSGEVNVKSETDNRSLHGIDVKIHPFSFMMGVANIEVEFLMNDHFGISPALYYLNASDEIETYKVKDVGLNVNYYLSTYHVDSFYLSPFIHFLEVTESEDYWDDYDNQDGSMSFENRSNNDVDHDSYLNIGMTIGYRSKTSSKIVYAGEIGFASNFLGEGGVQPTPFPIISLMVGYSF